ncbi:NACHT, LRR and PYD domains-containing protein 1b allele 5-like isoform X2 [Hemicordylus capensis]|uniref:NACHT, LRR and PYD domains-containing protein 1b allele 5-like isoform X2 n=1 Tax=Hemicordylus capensis TaxID=884348 RepID=UPI00230369EB|nr:NACHT, LRR and PYD domains-containing protein 1b allele 5-like isoform X2 [Hemicordylus capensis]
MRIRNVWEGLCKVNENSTPEPLEYADLGLQDFQELDECIFGSSEPEEPAVSLGEGTSKPGTFVSGKGTWSRQREIVKINLMHILMDLGRWNLKKFKAKLSEISVKEGFENIPKKILQKARWFQLSDILLKYYREDYALEVAAAVLLAIRCKDQAHMLLALSRTGTWSRQRETVKNNLSHILKDLGRWNLKRFKAKLSEVSVKEGFENIPKEILQKACWFQLSDILLAYYREEYALEVAAAVLEAIRCKDQAHMLLALSRTGTYGEIVNLKFMDIMRDLGRRGLKKFKEKLSEFLMKDELESIPKEILQKAPWFELSDILLKYYREDYAVEVSAAVLEAMNRKDQAHSLLILTRTDASTPEQEFSFFQEMLQTAELVEDNSVLNLTVEGEKEMREEEIEKTEIPEEDPWDIRLCNRCPPEENLSGKIRPEMVWDSQRSLEIYRMHCPEAGSFRCYYSNLIFEVREAVIITYWNDSWNQHLKGEKPSWMIIAGPLFNIQAEPGEAVEAVHLPHFLCLADEDPSQVQIAHFVEEGMSLEKPDSVESAHVVLKNPTFSPRGVIFRVLSSLIKNIRVHAMTLVYQAPDTSPKLHLYLLPNDRSLRKAVDEHERKCKSWRVQKPPTTRRPLTLGSCFCVQSSSDIEVSPREQMFEYLDSDMDQQYFEVYAEQMQKQLVLNLMEKDTNEQVWDATVRQGDLTFSYLHPSKGDSSCIQTDEPSVGATLERSESHPLASSELHFIEQHRDQLIQRTTDVEGTLDLLYGIILNQEHYEKITSKGTNQEKMRKLYKLLPGWDCSCKDKVYEALRIKNPFLIADLEGR